MTSKQKRRIEVDFKKFLDWSVGMLRYSNLQEIGIASEWCSCPSTFKPSQIDSVIVSSCKPVNNVQDSQSKRTICQSWHHWSQAQMTTKMQLLLQRQPLKLQPKQHLQQKQKRLPKQMHLQQKQLNPQQMHQQHHLPRWSCHVISPETLTPWVRWFIQSPDVKQTCHADFQDCSCCTFSYIQKRKLYIYITYTLHMNVYDCLWINVYN